MMDNNPWANEWFPMVHDGGSSLTSIANEVEAGYTSLAAPRKQEAEARVDLPRAIRRALRRPRLRVRFAKIGI